MIRDALLSDAASIATIFNYYVANTVITFDEDPVSDDYIKERIKSIKSKHYPYYVYEENGRVAGYAYLSDWRPHSAYRISLETTVYLAPDAIGKGMGSLLYAQLIEDAKKMRLHSLIGILAVPNEESRRLHKKFGFHRAGYVREAGIKFGRLVDVEFWQLIL